MKMPSPSRIILLALTFLLCMWLYSWKSGVSAQGAYGAVSLYPIAASVSTCPTPTSGSNAAIVCPVGSGTTYQLYISYNGLAYAPLNGGGGVTSFNGRTGAVVPQAGDYTATTTIQ